jgi:hypothetical protein
VPLRRLLFDTDNTRRKEHRNVLHGVPYNLARQEGLNHYNGFCLRISPLAPDGIRYPVADGGFTDWTARLLQNKKERLLTSGIGTEFVCFRYRTE